MKINNLEKFLAKARGGEMSLSFVVGMALAASCMAGSFNGLTADMASLCRLSDARSRSISPENFTGARNAGALADPVADKDKRNVSASTCSPRIPRAENTTSRYSVPTTARNQSARGTIPRSWTRTRSRLVRTSANCARHTSSSSPRMT